jgi:hypothetical protein
MDPLRGSTLPLSFSAACKARRYKFLRHRRRRQHGGTRNVGPNGVRPRPSAAGPYARPGRQGKDQRIRQYEGSERFAESHSPLARLAWTTKNLWRDSTPNVENCHLHRRFGCGAVLRRGGFRPPWRGKLAATSARAGLKPGATSGVARRYLAPSRIPPRPFLIAWQ